MQAMRRIRDRWRWGLGSMTMDEDRGHTASGDERRVFNQTFPLPFISGGMMSRAPFSLTEVWPGMHASHPWR